MVPLPDVALAFSTVLKPAQNDALPPMLAVGKAEVKTLKNPEVVEQPLLFVTTTVYSPPTFAV